MKNMKALMLMGLALAACQTQKGPVPDLVLMNGHIVTMDEGAPEAQAIAVAGNRILAVGTDVDQPAQAERARRECADDIQGERAKSE